MIHRSLKKISPIIKRSGIGASDIFVALVIASLIFIIIYNVHKSYSSKRNTQAVLNQIHKSSSWALGSIIDDLMKSSVYAAGCKSYGLIKPKYGGIASSDEITILTAKKFSVERLVDDMEKFNDPLPLPLGSSFRIGQKLAICDASGMEWFTVGLIGNKEKDNMALFAPEIVNGSSPLTRSYYRGSVVGDFEIVHYYIKPAGGIPTLYREVVGETEEAVTAGIENLKFEYFLAGSEIPLVDPMDLYSLNAVKVGVVARSLKEDPNCEDGIHSLTGDIDSFRRLSVSTKVTFDPVDVSKIKDIKFSIVKDKRTGESLPSLTSDDNNNDETY